MNIRFNYRPASVLSQGRTGSGIEFDGNSNFEARSLETEIQAACSRK